jgi:hypothetical protein
MQDLPEKENILLAVAKFLGQEVRPHVTDPRLSFRLLVAAHLCGVVAQECASEEEADAAELGRLAALLEGVPPSAHGRAGRAAIAAANVQLAASLRDGAVGADPGSPAWEHVMKTLTEKLAVSSARFDTRKEIES